MNMKPRPTPRSVFVRGDRYSKYLIYADDSGEYQVPNGIHNMPDEMAAVAKRRQACWGKCAYVRKSVFKFDQASFDECVSP